MVVLAALSARRRIMQNARWLAGVFILATLCGCAGLFPQTASLHEALAPELHRKVELKEVPFFPQTEYQCGPAALAMLLNEAGAERKRSPGSLGHTE